MMSTTNISSQSTKYYESAAGEYYDDERKISEWQGKIADRWGLEGKEVDIKTFDKLINGFGINNEKLVKSAGTDKHRGGQDLTFSAPKSVSILALEDTRLRDAHAQSVTASLKHVEQNYLQTRSMNQGEIKVESTHEFIVAKFEHHSNRNLEPQLHTHCAVMNMTVDSAGKFKTIHNDKIYVDQKKIGQVYRLELAKNISELGYAIEVVDRNKGLFEIKGVSPEIIKDFSTRRGEVLSKMEELKQLYPNADEGKLKEIAALESRTRKTKSLTSQEMTSDVNKVLAQSDLDLRSLKALTENLKEDPERMPAKEYIHEVIKGIEENQSAWRQSDVIDHASKLTLGIYNSQDLKKGFRELFQEKTISYIGNKELKSGVFHYYSSSEMKNIELKIVEEVKNGIGQSGTYISDEKYKSLESSIIKNHELTEGQKKALELMLTSKDKVIGVQGDAGTGKTYIMDIAREGFQKEKIEVIGLAPTGKAALELQEGAHLKGSLTIDSFLNKAQKGELFKEGHDKKIVLIIDEAGMVGSKKMEKILSFAKDKEIKIALVGDVKQFESIDQGKVFSDLQKTGFLKFSEMKNVLRQKTEETKAVVKHFSDYHQSGKKESIDKAFDTLDKLNKIHINNDYNKKLIDVKNEYMASEYNKTLVICKKNSERNQLNSMIRQELMASDKISSKTFSHEVMVSVSLSGKDKMFSESFKKDQVIVFSKNQGSIKKGTIGVISNINPLLNNIEVSYYDKNSKKDKKAIIDINIQSNSASIHLFEREKRMFSEGEKVIFTKNDSVVGVKNGQVGNIKSIKEDGSCVVSIGKKGVGFNFNSNKSNYYPYIDYGYALTEYKSQGATIDKLIWSVESHNASFNSGYVAMTRAKNEIKVFTDDVNKLKNSITKESQRVSALEILKNDSIMNLERSEFIKQR